MNFRLTAILFGIVFVIGVVLLIVSMQDDSTKTASSVLMEELALAGVKPTEIDAVEFERPNGGTLLLTRAASGDWQIQKPIAARAEAGRVTQLINTLMKAKPTPYKELTTNFALHGLEPPSLKVTLRKGSDVSSTINLGDVTFGDKGVVFVTTSSQSKRPMAVLRGELDTLFREPGSGAAGTLAKWINDYRSPAIFPTHSQAMGEDVASVKLTLPNKKKELGLIRSPSGWQFTSPAGWGAADSEGDPAIPFTGVRRLLGALTSMSVGSSADFLDAPKDMKEFGLDQDNPDLVKVEMKTRDGQEATVFIGKVEAPPVAKQPFPGAPPPGGRVYVRVDGQPGVIRATAGDLSGLVGIVNDPGPLRDRTLVKAEPNRVDGIDILLPGQAPDKPMKLRRTGGGLGGGQWSLYGNPGDPQKAAALPVEQMVDVLLAKRNIKDFPAPNSANFTPVSATVFVYVDGFTPSPDPKVEPTKRNEPIKLEFGKQEGDTVYVRRTLPGQPSAEFALPTQTKIGVGTTTLDLLKTLTKSRLDLLDPSLPPFSSANVVKLTVSRENKNVLETSYILEKDTQDDPYLKRPLWKFAAPEPKGRIADNVNVSSMLDMLASQQASRYVDEQPTDGKLIDYGFLPVPQLKVVVDLKDSALPPSPHAPKDPKDPKDTSEKREFEFGKPTGDPNYVYARIPGRPAVFTVPKLVYDRFANPDLKNRDIFRFNVADATKVRVKGWGSAGYVTELEFEKKDGTWTVAKAPMGYAVDPAKVNAFLEMLTRQRVKSFIPGPTNKVEYGFGDPKVFFQIDVEFSGGKPTLHMNVAAEAEGGASFYSWTNWVDKADQESPITLDAFSFKQYKASPGAFAK